MENELVRAVGGKNKIVKDTEVLPDQQLDEVWDRAPAFFGKELVAMVAARRSVDAYQGPLVQSQFPLLDYFNVADPMPKANEKKEFVLSNQSDVGTAGRLVLQWDDQAHPSKLKFTTKAGDVEEVALDTTDPRIVTMDSIHKRDGTVAQHDYNSKGDLVSGTFSKGKDKERFDFNSGFHVRSEHAGTRFELNDDSNGRYIETTVSPPLGRRSPTDIAVLKYVYQHTGDQDGELDAVVLTLKNGDIYRAHPDKKGNWIRQKLADPNNRLE